jgi:hypothetical protein
MAHDKELAFTKINIAAAILIYLVIMGMILSCNIVMLAQNNPQFRFTEVVSEAAATFNAAELNP